MAKEKKAAKGKEAPKVKGPRKSGKYKTVKTVTASGAPVKKVKVEKEIGPRCSLTSECKFAKVRKDVTHTDRRYCSLGIVEEGHCNYAKWGKKLRMTDLSARA